MWSDLFVVGGVVALVYVLYRMKTTNEKKDKLVDDYQQEKNEYKLPPNTTQFGLFFSYDSTTKGVLKLTESKACNVVGDILLEFDNNVIKMFQYDNNTNNWELQGMMDNSNTSRNVNYYDLQMDNGNVSIFRLSNTDKNEVAEEEKVFGATCGVTKSNRMVGPFNYVQINENISMIR